MQNQRASFLRIETDRATGKSEVEVAGTPPLLLFNLTALTAQVCEELNISPDEFAAKLSGYIRDYKETVLKAKFAVGYNPIRNGGTKP